MLPTTFPRLTRTEKLLGLSLHIIGTIFLARFIVDVGTRMLYPFIPQISAGLGLTVVGFGWLLFFRSLVGITGPIFGLWSDRYGRRQMMMLALLMQTVSVLGVAFSWQWWSAIPTILSGLSVAAFVPAQQAYISDRVPYQKRGRALASIEFAWSSSAIVALPVIGWMIDRFGWQAPYYALSLLSLVGAIVVWRQLPPAADRHLRIEFSWSAIQAILARANVISAISVALLVFMAATAYLSVWGIWLTSEFNFEPVALGLVGTGIGLAELVGAVLSSLFIDRIGKKRGSLGILIILMAGLTLLPLTQGAVFAAITALVVMGTFFEFAIVSLIPLFSEQVPAARGTVLSLVFFGIGVGSAIGTPVATLVWEKFGLGAVSMVAISCLLVSFGLTKKFLIESDGI